MRMLIALTAILLLGTYEASAKTLSFPNADKPMFQITIPDNWEPDADDDEVVEATSPKEHISMAIWEIKSKEELESFGKDIEEILSDHAKEIKLKGEPKEIKPPGMEGLLFSGSAIDKDDEDHKIEFLTLFLINKTSKQVAVVYIEADAETPKKEVDKLIDILKSIKQPK